MAMLATSMKAIALLLFVAFSTSAATLLPRWKVADSNLVAHFAAETEKLSSRCLADVKTAEDWKQREPEMRRELAEMLGLSPMPPRGDLKATITGRIEQEDFTVEKLHFQSLPQLYVTANLYIPKNLTKPAPTVLYVCGHSPVVSNGVSYGTKAAYQHHGIWFAQNGYICLVVDTLESGEILGQHHGTHRENMWWWNSRGYTPAGVETWNGMRALDYLSTRPEVDTNRFAITGRSGGGAQSWYITAMDERIRCAAPVAGITDLENHVVDGAVEGHCDCMFFVNTYRWDFPQLAALAAPRPLLVCNTDADSIFPLDGVVRLRDKVRRVYDLLGAGEKCGLVITPGPHKDTQELQVPVMRWFNRHLKGEDTLIENAAVKMFSPEQLKVFATLPGDALNARIHETFVELASPFDVPKSKTEWSNQREAWLRDLRGKSFQTWKATRQPLEKVIGNPGRTHYFQRSDMSSHVPLSLDVLLDQKVEKIELVVGYPNRRTVTNAPSIVQGRISYPFTGQIAFISTPRGLVKADPKPIDFEAIAKKETQIRRRNMLLGETRDSARVSDIVHAIEAIRAHKDFSAVPIRLEAEGDMAVNALYASLFAPVDELVLTHLPKSHTNGPDYLNVLRFLDIPQAVAMAGERCRVELRDVKSSDWSYPMEIAKQFGWEKHLRIVPSGGE